MRPLFSPKLFKPNKLTLGLSLGLMCGDVALCASKESLSSKQDGDIKAFLLTVEQGCLEQIIPLVENGASVNFKSSDKGFTPLMYASNEGHLEVVQYLLKQGAHIDEKCWEWFGGESALMYAAQQGHLHVVKCLIENGAELEFKGTYGHTPLMYALYANNIDVLEYLINQGAYINTQSNYGSTALINAAFNNKFDALKYLVEHGAEVNAVKSLNCCKFEVAF